MNRYKIKFLSKDGDSQVHLVAPDMEVAMMFFEMSMSGIYLDIISIDLSIVQISINKLCLN
jgi:hypothetical protein